MLQLKYRTTNTEQTPVNTPVSSTRLVSQVQNGTFCVTGQRQFVPTIMSLQCFEGRASHVLKKEILSPETEFFLLLLENASS